jgi:hypothetical protein
VSASRIVRFYVGDGPDHRGRDLLQLQNQTDDGLERNHDYIQWLFPLPEKSGANPEAPTLTQADIRAFTDSEELRGNLLKSLTVMLRFYGLEQIDAPEGVQIRRAESFEPRSRTWLTPFNHNFLRITRILRCLSLLGCDRHAAALFDCLQGIYRDHPTIIGQETFRYWKTARR